MEDKNELYIKLELIWWVFTLVFTGGVLYPIISKINDYPFLMINIIFIIVFITFTRHVFLLKHTFIAKKQLLKIILAILCLPIAIYLINSINFFQTYMDEQGMEGIVGDLPYNQQESMMSYIHSLLVFFGVGGTIATVIFAIRLIISVWKFRNRGLV